MTEINLYQIGTTTELSSFAIPLTEFATMMGSYFAYQIITLIVSILFVILIRKLWQYLK